MPTTVPNFLNNMQTPLGAAFANLAGAMRAGPSEADQISAADKALMLHRQVQGRQSLADRMAHLYAPPQQDAPAAMMAATPASPVQLPEAPAGMPSAVPTPRPDPASASPIAAAFASTQPQAAPAAAPAAPQPVPGNPADWGGLLHDAILGDVATKDLGGYNLFGSANQFGAKDDRTQNAQVGAGQTYENTFGALDRKQTDEMTKSDNTLKNQRNINAANIQKDYGIEGMKERHADAQAGASGVAMMDDATLDYLADQVRNGAPLPALGMGKQAAAARTEILTRAAQRDAAAGRDGTDAVIARQDYAGHLAGSRTLGNREASVGTAVNELVNIVPTTKALIGTVARSGLYPVDMILNAAQHGTNDPQLAKLAVSINDAVNAHARAINPQGQVTDAGRAQGYALLNQVQSPEAMGGALDQMMIGAERALAAPGQTRGNLHNSQRGTLGGGAPAAAPGGWTVKKVGQ